MGLEEAAGFISVVFGQNVGEQINVRATRRHSVSRSYPESRWRPCSWT